MRKKFYVFLIVLSIVISIVSFASAENKTDVISFAEYYSTLQDEYAKYGITFSIESTNPNAIYTQELLKQQLEEAQFFCETLHITTSPKVETVPLGSPVNPASMVKSYFYSSDEVTLTSGETIPKGTITFKLRCSGEVDIQNDYTISASGELRELSTINVAENNLTLDTTIQTSGSVWMVVSGSVKFAWTGPLNDIYTATIYGPFYSEHISPTEHIVPY